MKYRAEIDGLRAVALLPVIFFHAGFSYFEGGFVGVDIFFVISGYLITSIILAEKEKGSFSILTFYERRARRILPALFLVMFFSLVVSWFWLLPSDLKSFAQSLVAVSSYSSNVLFWLQSGYWGGENELKPLLHTWSLAVEEQYYFFFPLFLMLVWRYGRFWVNISFILIAILSLLLSQWFVEHSPTAAFFLLPMRAWELAVGASIAFLIMYDGARLESISAIPFVRILGEVTGLALIIISVLAFRQTTPFPGVNALLPTLGAGLIILFSSGDTFLGRLLSSKLLVGVGLISYSAYLWHQPLFSFARHKSLHEPGWEVFLILVVVTFIVSFLSWRYVERPFRGKGKVSRRSVFLFWGAGTLFFTSVGLAGHFTEGFKDLKFSEFPAQASIESKMSINHGLSDACDGNSPNEERCRTHLSPEVLVWGDSFAMHLVEGILSSKPDVKLLQVTKSMCGPFFNVAPTNNDYPEDWAQGCLSFSGELLDWLKSNRSVKYAVLSSPFSQYLSTEWSFLYRDGGTGPSGGNVAKKEFMDTLDVLISLGITPIVFSPPPASGHNLGRCLARAEEMGVGLSNCNFLVSELSEERRRAYDFLQEIEGAYRVVWMDRLLCENDMCRAEIDGIWIFRDSGHLSLEGASILGARSRFYDLISVSAEGQEQL